MYKVFVLLLMLSVNGLYGYVDPGTGSFIFQLLIVGITGGIYAIKVFWRQIASFFTSLFKRGPK